MTKTRRAAAAPERAMDDRDLDRWLQARRALNPLAKNLAMLDGFVTALAAGPLDLDLIGALLAALALDHEALNTGGTPEFAAIKAAVDRFNRMTGELEKGVVDPRRTGYDDVGLVDWCEGFLAAVNLNLPEWNTVMDSANPLHRLMLPILLCGKNEQGRSHHGPTRPNQEIHASLSEAGAKIQLSVVTTRNRYDVISTGQSRRR
jgi:yecA family protein